MSDSREMETGPAGIPAWAMNQLQCPITREPLETSDSELVRRLQTQQAQGKLMNRLGTPCSDPFDSGLVNRSGSFFYPVRAGVPSLVPQEAIPL